MKCRGSVIAWMGCFWVASTVIAQESPLPPQEAASTLVLPKGFEATLFAGEPDLVQPIGFCIDDRGRLWVAEANNYPDKNAGQHDRILIYEDTDGDGRFDKRKVFYDKLGYVSGIEVGFGGAWVMSIPNFYFIPDRDGDDVPDGEPEVLLDGFGTSFNAHNIANGFAWGPDGWLYGTHGRTNWSMLGKPGTPEAQRVRFDGGVYRYHPVRRVWEPFADGTTNPWGIDWDDWGQAFVCNCVNPHLYHVIQGAHYEPWRNRASSLHAYERIDTIADHLHFLGGTDKIRDKLGSAEELGAGGGHAHCGTMVYLGDNWPASYRNGVFMNNIHGKRMNHDVPMRRGSGYTASHAPDVMISTDPWFMGVTLAYGPDGGVFVSDWSDTGECHSVKNTRKHTGRIFKITYGKPKPVILNLETATDTQLVEWQLHRNDWWVRHSRRLLQERAAAGQDMTVVHTALIKMLEHPDVTRRLRALWALHVTGGGDETLLGRLLADPDEHLRAWAIRLLCEAGSPSVNLSQTLAKMAAEDPSPLVRLHLASALQRLPVTERWAIAQGLVAHEGDADDPNLPLMIWYGIEPLVEVDPERFVQLAAQAKIPLIRRHVARRVAAASR